MSSESYEKNASLRAAGLTNTARRQGIKVLDDISITDIAEINTEDEMLRLIVQGHLEDIRELKDMPETLKIHATNYVQTPHKDNFLTAKLVDDSVCPQ